VLECFACGHDAVGESHPERFVSAHAPTGENEVERVAVAEEPGQTERPAVHERDPHLRQYTPKTASTAATRRSHHAASSSPPATACPSTAAMTGLREQHPVGPTGRRRRVRRGSLRSRPGSLMALRSAPHRRCHPLRSARRPPGPDQRRSPGTRSRARWRWGGRWRLATSGRSMVTIVTGPSCTTRMVTACPSCSGVGGGGGRRRSR